MAIGLVFPGQGAQYVGMGKELADAHNIAKETFEQADDSLGFSLAKMIFAGPDMDLRLTYYTQPAILTVSIAAFRVLNQEVDIKPMMGAGHSLGEYSALVAAGAIPFADAVKLVHERGKYMDDSYKAGLGAMAAVLGADLDALEALCRTITDELHEPVDMANVNCPGQVVVSGTKNAVQLLIDRAKTTGARRAVLLDVSGPFHSSLMGSAVSRLQSLLEKQSIMSPAYPIVSNVTVQPLTDPQEIKKTLAQQVASPVLWEASVRQMVGHGIHTFIECGPGTVLSGLVRKIDRTLQTMNVENQSSLRETVMALRQEGGSA